MYRSFSQPLGGRTSTANGLVGRPGDLRCPKSLTFRAWKVGYEDTNYSDFGP